jgi:hypothetical protein
VAQSDRHQPTFGGICTADASRGGRAPFRIGGPWPGFEAANRRPDEMRRPAAVVGDRAFQDYKAISMVYVFAILSRLARQFFAAAKRHKPDIWRIAGITSVRRLNASRERVIVAGQVSGE